VLALFVLLSLKVTETLSPADTSFEQRQVAKLEGRLATLHQSTGR
jgi:hypothetical protein